MRRRWLIPIMLILSGQAHALSMINFEGVISGSDPSLPMMAGDRYTGVLTYTPELANGIPVGGACYDSILGYEIAIGGQWIQGSGDLVCLDDSLPGRPEAQDIDPLTSFDPAGYIAEDMLWSGLDTGTGLPTETQLMNALIGSSWEIFFFAPDSGGERYLFGEIDGARIVAEPASFAILGLGLVGLGLRRRKKI